MELSTRQQSLKWIKSQIKRRHTSGHISTLESFLSLFEIKEGHRERIGKALELLIMDKCGVVCSSSQAVLSIEQFYSQLDQLGGSRMRSHSTHHGSQLSLSTVEPAAEVDLPFTDFLSPVIEEVLTALYHHLIRFSTKKTSMLTHLKLLGTRFEKEKKWVQQIEQRCTEVFGSKQTLTLLEFNDVFNCSDEFGERAFLYFNKSGAGVLTITEFLVQLTDLLTGDKKTKLAFLFQMFDKNGDGFLCEEELKDVLTLCLDESKLSLHEDLASELTKLVWCKMSDGHSDYITFTEFYNALKEYPSVYNNLHIDVIETSHGLNKAPELRLHHRKPASPDSCAIRLKRTFIHTAARFQKNTTLVVWCIVYFIVSGLLTYFRIAALTPRPVSETCYVFAKVAGQLLNFNIALALLLTLKHTATKLRRHSTVRGLFPLDDLLCLHKTVAYIAVFLSCLHMVAHVIHACLTYFIDNGWPIILESDFLICLVTSIVLLVSLVVFLVTTAEYVRHKNFDLFLRFHQISAIVWVIALVLHSENTWKWLVGPASLVFAERFYFLIFTCVNRTKIETGSVHGNVTKLTIRKPRFFNYKPGDYVIINIPALSRSQWHPFTISSSPHHQNDCFTLHITKAGSWTSQLHKTVTEETKTQGGLGVDNPVIIQVDDYDSGLKSSASMSSLSSGMTSECDLDCPPPTPSATTLSPHQKIFTISDGNTDVDSVFSDDSGALCDIPMCSHSSSQAQSSLGSPKSQKSQSVFTVSMADMDKPAKMTRTKSMLSMLSMSSINMEEAPVLNWEVYLDGPHSTPSRDILKSRHAILVAGGIGVTPFASVLQSVLKMLKQASEEALCQCCDHTSGNRICRKQTKLEKIDFIWLTRDHTHLAWFQQAFSEIEEVQASLGLDLINLHIYLTGLKQATDLKGTWLQLALEMAYHEDKMDILSGLKARTRPGRPIWEQVLPNITKTFKSSNKSPPRLFVCGPTRLCSDLKKECYRNSIIYKEEVF